MKAVAINGSPRKGGNTEILLKKVLAPLAAAGWETEFIQLGGAPSAGARPVTVVST
jgi:multimeric flavodoxin WrbA